MTERQEKAVLVALSDQGLELESLQDIGFYTKVGGVTLDLFMLLERAMLEYLTSANTGG